MERQLPFAAGVGSENGLMKESGISIQPMRFEVMDQWWHWLIMLVVMVTIVGYVVYWYRRDWIELPRGLGWALLWLRLTALLGIALFFLDFQRRAEQTIIRPSRVAVLVDTSLSMSLPIDQQGLGGSAPSRMEATIDFLRESPFLAELQQQHEVHLYRFDQLQRPTLFASLTKPSQDLAANEDRSAVLTQLWYWVSRVVWLGSFLGLVAIMALGVGLSFRIRGSKAPAWPYLILAGVVLLIVALVVIATALLRGSDLPLASLGSWSPPAAEVLAAQSGNPKVEQLPGDDLNQVDWSNQLMATGIETRLGDAVQAILEQERGNPLAAIVMVSDGQSNAGVDPVGTVSAAGASNVKLYAIGVGSAEDPVNARIVDVEAPKRVYPGDRFRLTALLQASGLQGKSCVVQLRRRASGAEAGNLTIEEELQVELNDGNALSPVYFDVKPREIGSWVYDVKLLPPPQDSNQQDNQLDTEVRVVEPRTTVLILAGGPTREYQFVRNLLFRDQAVQSHVFLQTGTPGMSQEADQLLTAFPSNMAEMAQYDCVIAFDADWMSLSVPQLEVLEKWVAQQAGGLILVLGPVASPKWTGTSGNGDRRAEILRNLSPMVLNGRGTRLVSMGRFESESVWPLKFSEDARTVDFLELSENPEESRDLWSRFTGVYSFYASYEPKPGALPLAYFSDPATALEGKFPIFLATQFYGAGRVIAQGSGEIWRLRQLSDDYFDTYYTKLVRWASQSRLLRDSDRGLLLVDKQEALVGEQVNVRAVLRDEQFQPLLVASAAARLIDPNGKATPLELTPLKDPNQLGTYIGQFLAKQTGSYELRLPVGSLADQEVISQQVTVRIPTREIQRPQRNDPLLRELTERTQGMYYATFAEALQPVEGGAGEPSAGASKLELAGRRSQLAARIVSVEQRNTVAGAPDHDFQQRLMGSLMALIGTALSLEWLLRRLSKLA